MSTSECQYRKTQHIFLTENKVKFRHFRVFITLLCGVFFFTGVVTTDQRRFVVDSSLFVLGWMPFSSGSPLRAQPLPLTVISASATQGLQSFNRRQNRGCSKDWYGRKRDVGKGRFMSDRGVESHTTQSLVDGPLTCTSPAPRPLLPVLSAGVSGCLRHPQRP